MDTKRLMQTTGLLLTIAALLVACASETRPPLETDSSAELTAASSNIMLYDTFDVNIGLWGIFSEFDSAAQIINGQLEIQVGQPGQVALSLASFALNDFDLSVNTAQLSGPNANGYGIIFRYTGPNDFYRFDIAGDGHWGLSRYIDGSWQPQVPLTRSVAIRTGQSNNTLRVIMKGGQLVLYVNDIILTVTQIEPGTGRIGLFASTFDEGGVQITFDEVLIRNP